MTTRTYRLDHDLGFAPNPYFGWCTLACCMPAIRQHAKPGDVVVGMAGSSAKGLGRIHPQLIYWMLVEEAMSFDDYWADPRFVLKRPNFRGPQLPMVGDRTYRHEHGEWVQESSMHYLPDADPRSGGHLAKDVRVDRVLVGARFTYWGGSGPVVPDRLLPLFTIRNQKCPSPGPLLDELHALADVAGPRGVVGDPADWENSRYFR